MFFNVITSRASTSNLSASTIRTPVSPTAVITSSSPIRPLVLSGSSPTPARVLNHGIVPATRKPRSSAGIQARQDKIAAQERAYNFKTRINDRSIEAVNFLRDKCVICWLYRKSYWKEHSSDNCCGDIGTNKGDQEYSFFRSHAIRLRPGWCFSCLIHQARFLFFSFSF